MNSTHKLQWKKMQDLCGVQKKFSVSLKLKNGVNYSGCNIEEIDNQKLRLTAYGEYIQQEEIQAIEIEIEERQPRQLYRNGIKSMQ